MWVILFTYPFITVVFGLPLLALYFTKGYLPKITALIILGLLIWMIMKKAVVYVEFDTKNIYVKRVNKIITYQYDEISKFNENKEGFLPYSVIVAKYKENKLFHFYCQNEKRKDLDSLLKSKGHSIKAQV